MTLSYIFTEAHKQASIDHRKFGGSYRQCFTNALAGFYAVRAGYRGVQIVEGRMWA